MSVIQAIQEKYAKLMAVIIALALVIFVVMLAFENGGSLFQPSNQNSVGVINGETVDLESFNEKVEQTEASMQQQGYPASAALSSQAREQAWNEEVRNLALQSEVNKLGMTVGKPEFGDILYGENPPQDLKQGFTDPNTGVFNAQEAKNQLEATLRDKSTDPQKVEQRKQIGRYFDYLETQRLREKYVSLIANTETFPKWLVEKEIADNSQQASISFVSESYSSVADSTVKVSDKEIEDYINKHKNEFKQLESRGIAYVAFPIAPLRSDSANALDKANELKAKLAEAQDINALMMAEGNNNYYDSYISGKAIQIAQKDSIFAQPVNTVYGPYMDGNTYTIAKVTGVRQQPDTVTIRHILIGTVRQDPQTRQAIPIRDSATAFKLADSIQKAIAAGSNFDSMVVAFSDDEGSKATGGKYENVASGGMVAPFNDFIFGKPVGSKGIVNTQFGSHYIEVLSAKGSTTAYRVAYLNAPVEVSAETENQANSEASAFAASARNQKEFDAAAEKLKARGIAKTFASDITPTASQIQGLGISRNFVKEIYAADKGDVLQPEKVGENMVVAIVTDINKKGTQSVQRARPLVESALRNQKKGEIIAKRLGKISTLEAAAASFGGKEIVRVDSLKMSGAPNMQLGPEVKVIGAAFNPANKGKVVPEVIYGQSAVYVVRVEGVSATPVDNANVAEERNSRYMQAKMRSTYPEAALVEAAKIEDNRAKLF